jgi:hypothetical protein
VLRTIALLDDWAYYIAVGVGYEAQDQNSRNCGAKSQRCHISMQEVKACSGSPVRLPVFLFVSILIYENAEGVSIKFYIGGDVL